MVKNRKPLMVSEQALQRLKELAREKNIFMGDLVDNLLNLRTEEDLNKEYELKPHISKRLRKGHAGSGEAERGPSVGGSPEPEVHDTLADEGNRGGDQEAGTDAGVLQGTNL